MFDEMYRLYLQCFPGYPTSESLFFDLLKPNSAHIIAEYDEGKMVGTIMMHGKSISLLCVDENYRNRGYGSRLLENAENYIERSGEDKIILGRGRYYLLQGVPTDNIEAVGFFEKRGYKADWTSENMRLSLDEFDPASLNIPKAPKTVTFRFACDQDSDELLEAVSDAQRSWKEIFMTCADPIFLAVDSHQIVGFEVLSPSGGRFNNANNKSGSIGCVGVIHSARKSGIGRQMVVEGAQWLKSQGCRSIELRYVALVDWYKKIGFKTTGKQWMGEKLLVMK